MNPPLPAGPEPLPHVPDPLAAWRDVVPFLWVVVPPPPAPPPMQPWNPNVYAAMGTYAEPESVVARVRAAIEADPAFAKWKQVEMAKRTAEREAEIEQLQADLDRSRERLDRARLLQSDPLEAVWAWGEEVLDLPGVEQLEQRVEKAEYALHYAQTVPVMEPDGLTAIQSRDLVEFLEHPRSWGENDGILQTQGMKVKLMVADAPFEGEVQVATTVGSDRTTSDTSSSKTTHNEGQTATRGEKGGLGMSGPSIEATRSDQVNVGTGSEEGTAHTAARVDKDSTTVARTAESKSRDVYAQVTTVSGTVTVNLGPLPVARPK
jgi:hypothetical protein